MKSKPTWPAFPLETIFPGTHAERPDIAAREAADFLAYGHLPRGFDPLDPEVRAELVDVPPEKFGIFMVNPLPAEAAAMLSALPDNWEQDQKWGQVAVAATDRLAELLKLPPHLCCILDGKDAWVYPKSQPSTGRRSQK